MQTRLVSHRWKMPPGTLDVVFFSFRQVTDPSLLFCHIVPNKILWQECTYIINPPVMYIVSSPFVLSGENPGEYIQSVYCLLLHQRGVINGDPLLIRVSLVVTLRHEQRGRIRVAAAAAAIGAAASEQRHSLPPSLLVGECQRMVRPRAIQISYQEDF
jgi:hypothetical protein